MEILAYTRALRRVNEHEPSCMFFFRGDTLGREIHHYEKLKLLRVNDKGSRVRTLGRGYCALDWQDSRSYITAPRCRSVLNCELGRCAHASVGCSRVARSCLASSYDGASPA
jgi:hypothetical protein